MRSPSLVLASAALALAACSKDPAPAPTPTSTAATQAPTAASPPVATPAPAGEVEVGKPAPAFSVTATDGTKLDSARLKGKHVVVYFYPKDETPGCTKEAQSFRDEWKSLEAKGVVLIGVSADSDESHKAFAAHHKLPFLLVSDPKNELGAKFGVPFTVFHSRQSFVIGPDGNVKKIYRKVDVGVHDKEILGDVT